MSWGTAETAQKRARGSTGRQVNSRPQPSGRRKEDMSLKRKGHKPTSRPSGMIPRTEVQSVEGRHSDGAKSSWSWKLALAPHLHMSPPDLLSSQQSGACSRFLTLAKQPFAFSGSVLFLASPQRMASFSASAGFWNDSRNWPRSLGWKACFVCTCQSPALRTYKEIMGPWPIFLN